MPSALETPPASPESPGRAPFAGGPGPPPDEGGGGGGGDGESHESGPPISPEKVGVIVFIVFVTMLFAGCLSAYSVIRISTRPWPPPGFPPLPRGLWGSTAVIVASSLALVWGTRAARLGRPGPARAGLGATTLLGFGFLALQVLLWRRSLLAGLPIAGTLYGAFFYTLTGLHALHVLGGLLVLAVSFLRSLSEADAGRLRRSLEVTGLYWHFVGAMWLLLFGVLYLAE